MASWKTTFLYKQWVFHFHVSESDCKTLVVTLIGVESDAKSSLSLLWLSLALLGTCRLEERSRLCGCGGRSCHEITRTLLLGTRSQ